MSDFVVGMIYLTGLLGAMFMWIFCLFDLFFRSDLPGWQKAVWLLVIIFVPIIGALAYLVMRPKSAKWGFAEQDEDMSRQIAANGTLPTSIESLRQLRSQGVISEEEYSRMRERVSA